MSGHWFRLAEKMHLIRQTDGNWVTTACGRKIKGPVQPLPVKSSREKCEKCDRTPQGQLGKTGW